MNNYFSGISIISIALSLLAASYVNTASASDAYSNPKEDIDAIREGTGGLPKKYDGSGVTVGILDMGFDPNHVAFAVSGDISQSRVKAFYTWKNSTFALEDLSGFTTDTRNSYHGTHVAGIAAGGYSGAGQYNDGNGVRTYTAMPVFGVASNADIVMLGAGGNLSSAQLKEGAATLTEYAESTGRPMVVNISSGDIKGSHSGSGDGVTGSSLADYTGKGPMFCVATGNEGAVKCTVSAGGGDSDDECSFGIPFTSSQIEFYIYTTPRLKAGVSSEAQINTTMVEPMQIDFIVYDSTTGKICYSRNIYEIYQKCVNRGIAGSTAATTYSYTANSDFDSWFTSDSYIRVSVCGCVHTTPPATMGPPLLNDRSEWLFSVSTLLKSADGSRYKPGLYIRTQKGEKVFGYTTSFSGMTSHGVGSATSTDGSVTYPAWRDGSTDGSMSAIATLDNVISVGACSAVSRLGTLNGNSYSASVQPGEIWPSSSYGMNTSTGERLPHVVAPGYSVVSAANRYYDRGYAAFAATAACDGESYNWIHETGTSMASPFVAGTIALWLQADPDMTVDDVKEVLRKTNVYPAGVASLPEDDERRLRWGGGMIQPLAGLKYILEKNGTMGIAGTDADSRLLVEQYGREINVFMAGTDRLTARLYTLDGVCAATVTAESSEVSMTAPSASSALYLLEIISDDCRLIRKIIVR